MKIEDNWDVNILLDYFVQLGPNSQIADCNVLGGKLLLQILITQMCRSCEAAQLQLSTLCIIPDGVEFTLLNPTKTYNHKTYKGTKKLQVMTIKPFSGHPCLCPLDTLMAYIERTKPMRQKVDKLFVLVTTNIPRPATRTTIVRWAKNIMRVAGLETQTIHSTRGATSSAGLLLGLPLDQIVSCVGWTKASTFIKHYMKPVIQQISRNTGSTHNLHMSPAQPPAPSHQESLKAMLSTLPQKRKPKDMPTFPPSFDHCSLGSAHNYKVSADTKSQASHTISKPPPELNAQPVQNSGRSDIPLMSALPDNKYNINCHMINLTAPPSSTQGILKPVTTPSKLLTNAQHVTIPAASTPTISKVLVTPHPKTEVPQQVNTKKVKSTSKTIKVAPRNQTKHVSFQLGTGPPVSKLDAHYSSVTFTQKNKTTSLPVTELLSIDIPPEDEWLGMDISQHSASLLGIGADLPLTFDLDKEDTCRKDSNLDTIMPKYDPAETPGFALDHTYTTDAEFSESLAEVAAQITTPVIYPIKLGTITITRPQSIQLSPLSTPCLLPIGVLGNGDHGIKFRNLRAGTKVNATKCVITLISRTGLKDTITVL